MQRRVLSTSTWLHLELTKVACYPHTSTCLSTSQAWRRLTCNSWPMPSATSITTGLALSRFQLLASMLTRSPTSTWPLEWQSEALAIRARRTRVEMQPSRSQLSSRTALRSSLSITNFTTCEVIKTWDPPAASAGTPLKSQPSSVVCLAS